MLRQFLTKLVLLPVVIGAAGCSTSHLTNPNAIAEIDHRFQELISAGDYPGVVVSITRNGETILEKSYGFSDLEGQVPASPSIKYEIGSLTKGVTSVAIAQLVHERKLSLSTTLGELFPEFPPHLSSVTISQLMTHTSGIPDFARIQEAVALSWVPSPRKTDVLSTFIHRDLQFKSGSSWEYSNSGTWLLGLVIEKVSGLAYGEYLKGNVLGPLGLNQTGFLDRAVVRPGAAKGYDVTETGFVPKRLPQPENLPFAAGGIYSTMDDLQSFYAAIFGDFPLGKDVQSILFSEKALDDGRAVPYLHGAIRVSDFGGHKKYYHSGEISGFLSHYAHYPNEQLTIIILANAINMSKHLWMIESDVAASILELPVSESEKGLVFRSHTGCLGSFEAQGVGSPIESFSLRETTDGRTLVITDQSSGEAVAEFPAAYVGANTYRSEFGPMEVLVNPSGQDCAGGVEVLFNHNREMFSFTPLSRLASEM